MTSDNPEKKNVDFPNLILSDKAPPSHSRGGAGGYSGCTAYRHHRGQTWRTRVGKVYVPLSIELFLFNKTGAAARLAPLYHVAVKFVLERPRGGRSSRPL